MNAEAQAWSVAPFDPDSGGIAAAPSGRPGAPASRGPRRTVRSASRPPQVVGPDGDDVSWNVLAEELLPYPRPARRVLLEVRPDARGRTRVARDDREDAAHARRYSEAWLERELIAVRYRADAGYPALDRRLMGTAGPPPAPAASRAATARVATARVATARPGAGGAATADAAVARMAGHLGISNPERRARGVREAAQTRTGAVAEPRGLRRLLPGVVTLAVLAGLWVGAGMLAAGQRPALTVLQGSVRTPAGYVYVVRPGDTLWSIATRLQPGGDPRVIVAELEGQVRGATLVPGSRLVLP